MRGWRRFFFSSWARFIASRIGKQVSLTTGTASLYFRISYVRVRDRGPAVPSLNVCQGGDTTGETARVLIEDVHDAIFDLVELIKTFQSKNKLSKVFLSTLFKRRQEELDAVVDRAIMRLQVRGLSPFSLLILRRQARSVRGTGAGGFHECVGVLWNTPIL